MTTPLSTEALERLREAVISAARDLIESGLRNNGEHLVVIEKRDRSDPHYRLCAAFEALDGKTILPVLPDFATPPDNHVLAAGKRAASRLGGEFVATTPPDGELPGKGYTVAARPASPVPEGFALVPIEPTEADIERLARVLWAAFEPSTIERAEEVFATPERRAECDEHRDIARVGWPAMLAAAVGLSSVETGK